jgi:hypothetical protein
MTAELTTFVDIRATPERVWKVLADLPAYAEWNPFVTRAEGVLVTGERLSVNVPPVNALLPSRLRPRVLEATPGRRLRLRSTVDRLGLLTVEYTVTITDHDGGVRVWHQDRFRGLLAPLLIRALNRRRLSAFTSAEAALKDRVEALPASPA